MTGSASRRDVQRFWVLGGRWVEDAQHLPWPRVLGPYRDCRAARDSAEALNRMGEPGVRYLVVADVGEEAA